MILKLITTTSYIPSSLKSVVRRNGQFFTLHNYPKNAMSHRKNWEPWNSSIGFAVLSFCDLPFLGCNTRQGKIIQVVGLEKCSKSKFVFDQYWIKFYYYPFITGNTTFILAGLIIILALGLSILAWKTLPASSNQGVPFLVLAPGAANPCLQ